MMRALIRFLVITLLITAGVTWAIGYFVFGAADRQGHVRGTG